MGGNAIKGAVRLEASLYQHVARGYVDTLKIAFPNARIDVIPAYREKKDFGDMDILISEDVPMDQLIDYHNKVLGGGEMVKNGNVLSVGMDLYLLTFKHEIFQVDFIRTPNAYYDFALRYFSYNDLGNLIGQTAHGIGLKFGHDGLWFRYRDGTELIGDICITQDFDDALAILGYDYGRYSQGFNNLEEIFEYVVTSDMFTSWNYQLENRNAVGRIRDKKRSTYMSFLKWMEGRTLPTERGVKDVGINAVRDMFPHVEAEYKHLTWKHELTKVCRLKFNGDVVRQLTGLEGKELGALMKKVRESREDFVIRVHGMTQKEVDEMVMSHYEEMYKK